MKCFRDIAMFVAGAAAALIMASMTADAQLPGGVTVHGSVIVGHCVEWYSATQVEDSGGSC